MKLYCWYCHKPVSNDLPETALFRAIAVCPECIGKSDKSRDHPLLFGDIPPESRHVKDDFKEWLKGVKQLTTWGIISEEEKLLASWMGAVHYYQIEEKDYIRHNR